MLAARRSAREALAEMSAQNSRLVSTLVEQGRAAEEVTAQLARAREDVHAERAHAQVCGIDGNCHVYPSHMSCCSVSWTMTLALLCKAIQRTTMHEWSASAGLALLKLFAA